MLYSEECLVNIVSCFSRSTKLTIPKEILQLCSKYISDIKCVLPSNLFSSNKVYQIFSIADINKKHDMMILMFNLQTNLLSFINLNQLSHENFDNTFFRVNPKFELSNANPNYIKIFNFIFN